MKRRAWLISLCFSVSSLVCHAQAQIQEPTVLKIKIESPALDRALLLNKLNGTVRITC